MKHLILIVWAISLLNYVSQSQESKIHHVISGEESNRISDFNNLLIEKSNQAKLMFSKSSKNFTLILEADFQMDYVWIFNSDSLNIFILPRAFSDTVIVPNGTLNILTGNNINIHQNMILLKENVVVDSSLRINFSKNEANKNIYFEFLKEDYSLLHINAIALLLMYNEHYNQGLAIINTQADTTTYWFKSNHSLSIFRNEWSVKGKQLDNNGKLYLLNNSIDSVYNNLTITNDPINFTHADFQYHFPDSVEQNSPSVQVGTANYGYHMFSNDPNYRHPFSFRILQDTSSNFSLDMSRFEQVINAQNTFGDDIVTSEMRIGANNVKGYTTVSRYNTPFLISENKIVHIGVTPTYFYGQCQNTQNEIRISAPFNYPIAQQPFLSLTNDVLKHFPYNLKLFQDGNLIEERVLNIRWGHPALFFGCEPTDLIFSVATDEYEVTAIDDKSEVAGMNASTTAYLKFELSKQDKNPPNMTLFQILSNNTITNELDNDNTNIIRFRIEDDQYISDVHMHYSLLGDTAWMELPLIANNTYLETQVPILANGYYSLKTICTDSTNNILEMMMEPAFLMESSSSISDAQKYPSEFKLYQNYPNPFNNETTISFLVPDQLNKKVNLSIYNILGKNIITLIDRNLKPGIKKIKWNGLNKYIQPISSGVYFLQLKGGDFVQRRKLIIIK